MAGLTSGSPQTDYGFSPPIAVLGQLFRSSTSDEIVDYVASAPISPGQLCEVVAGTAGAPDTARPAQSAAGALKPLAGVALYKDPRVPALGFAFPGGGGVFQAGDRVPFLRKGRMYAAWTGAATGQGALIGVNYTHYTVTTATTLQGYFTVAATSATTGAEVDVATGVRLLRKIGSTSMCLVELNLPGALSISGP